MWNGELVNGGGTGLVGGEVGFLASPRRGISKILREREWREVRHQYTHKYLERATMVAACHDTLFRVQ